MTMTMQQRAVAWRVLTYYDASIPPELLPGAEPPPEPVLEALAPVNIVAGAPPALVTLTGTGFIAGSKVWADEVAQLTTFVDDVTLTYNAQADMEGTQTVTVRNGALISDPIELVVDPPAQRAADEEAAPDEPPPGDQPATEGQPAAEPDEAPDKAPQAEAPAAKAPNARKRGNGNGH